MAKVEAPFFVPEELMLKYSRTLSTSRPLCVCVCVCVCVYVLHALYHMHVYVVRILNNHVRMLLSVIQRPEHTHTHTTLHTYSYTACTMTTLIDTDSLGDQQVAGAQGTQ